MKQKLRENKLLVAIIVIMFFMFFLVAYYIMSINKTTYAVVLNADAESGTTITEDMVETIEVPASVPSGFLKQEDSVIGYKLKTSVTHGQLLYESDFMSSFTDYNQMDDVPDDYAITSLCVPDTQACGGVITAGDYVDILSVIPSTDGQNTQGNVEYVLSNVKVLSTNSSLSEAQESDLSTVSDESSGSSDGSYYIFALSYDDLKKLRTYESTDGAQLWINISAKQNQEEGKDPLIDQMNGLYLSGLHDAQLQVLDEDGNLLEGFNPSGNQKDSDTINPLGNQDQASQGNTSSDTSSNNGE